MSKALARGVVRSPRMTAERDGDGVATVVEVPPQSPARKLPNIHVSLDEPTYQRLQHIARTEERPLSALVRLIIHQWLDGTKP